MQANPTRRALLGGAGAAAVLPFTGAPAGAAADLDADLIDLCAQHIANYHAFNTSYSDLESGDDPLWLAYMQTREAISVAKAQTVEGLIAKACVTKIEARRLDGSEDHDRELCADWAWGIVNDLLRLHGEAAA